MYDRCHVCERSLGRNNVIAAMPVGRRLAFDVERGRLWVVCPRCGEWNLTPLEERWEAVESCERLFASAPVRASSKHMGLARTPDVELVRVGAAALRDELANWRYGPRLRRRRRRAVLLLAGAGVATGSIALAAWGIALAGAWAVELVRGIGPVGATSFIGPHGERVRLTQSLVERVRMARTSGAKGPRALVAVAGPAGQEMRYGREVALRLLAGVLPRLNWRGTTAGELARATRIVDAEEAIAADRARRGGDPQPPWQRVAVAHWPPGDLLFSMEPVARLAFEMAVTEEVKRRALAGEAATLEGRWREAEEVAGIADALFLPAFVTDWLARHGRGSGKTGTSPGSAA